MRTFTPEISWHNRLPALSLDISPPIDSDNNATYRVATGGNDCRVYIWHLTIVKDQSPDIRIRAGLRRHQRSVGAVRFSSQHVLASGDDDGYIYLWKYKMDDRQELDYSGSDFLNEDGFEDMETWQNFRVLRGHIEDICDLTWSKDGQYLLSGSVDNSAILWDTVKGSKIWCSDLIKGYVQGVAIDPHYKYMVALSSDRALRVYNFVDKRLVYATRRTNVLQDYKAIFCDDTVQTFCRRLEFSPDGQYLVAPTSRLIERGQPRLEKVTNSEVIEIDEEDYENGEINVIKDQEVKQQQEPEQELEASPKTTSDEVTPAPKKKPINIILVFKRTNIKKPVHYYPTGREVALCIKFSPIVYKLRGNGGTNFWSLPYRVVFAVGTSRSIIIYDSQQPTPIAYISQIHLARLTDLSWSHDGQVLMVTSYDGYSTLIIFEKNEFGEIYTGSLLEPADETSADETEASVKGKKRSKGPKDGSKKEKLSVQEGDNQEGGSDGQNEQNEDQNDSRAAANKKATPRKIVPTRLPESSTIFKYLIKKPAD